MVVSLEMVAIWRMQNNETATMIFSKKTCVSVSVCVHDTSKNNGSGHLKLEHIVGYENSSDEFDIGHCPIKVKVTA